MMRDDNEIFNKIMQIKNINSKVKKKILIYHCYIKKVSKLYDYVSIIMVYSKI